MKKGFILIILTVLFFAPVFGQNPPQDKNWGIIFQDDFSKFNTNRWKKTHKHIRGNGIYEESQIYDSTNIYIDNGKLVLRTRIQNSQCPKGSNCHYGGRHSYTSGEIDSKITYKYGYFEIYAKLPASSGYWPAFWFWNSTGSWYNEIDVFEAYGNRSKVVESNAHCGFGGQASTAIGAIEHICYYDTDYHWYGVEWNRDRITWYIDRKPVRQELNNMEGIGIQNPMYIIMNVALSSIYPGWDNQISSSTIFPNYMYVDQANVYRLKCDKNTVVNEILNFNTFYYAVKKSISLSNATTIPSGSNISLRATDFIELKSGFGVPLNSEFYLDVNPCE